MTFALSTEKLTKLLAECEVILVYKHRASILLTISFLCMWVIAILIATPVDTICGVVKGVHPLYLVALCVLIVASSLQWLSRNSSTRLMWAQLILLVSALFLIPVFSGYSPPLANHSLRTIGLVEYIVRTGTILPNELWYLNWPGAFVLPVFAVKLFSFNLETLLNYAPYIMSLCYLPPLYVLFRNLLGNDRKNLIFTAISFFMVANWVGSEYMASPPAVALLFVITLLALITSEPKRRYLAGIVVVFGCLVTTHLLFSIAMACILCALALVKWSKPLAIVSVVSVVILVAWNLTVANTHTSWLVEDVSVVAMSGIEAESIERDPLAEFPLMVSDGQGFESIIVPERNSPVEGRTINLSLPFIIEGQILSHLSGSNEHIMVGVVRVVFSAVFLLLGIAGLVIAVKDRSRRRVVMMMLAIMAVSVSMVILPYGGRIIDRVYPIPMLALSYFAVTLLDRKKWGLVFCTLLIICAPVHVIAHYGNQVLDNVSQEYMDGINYFHDISPDGGTIIAMGYLWTIRNKEKYRYIPLARLQWHDSQVYLSGKNLSGPYWLIITEQERALCDFIYDYPEFPGQLSNLLNVTEGCNLVHGSEGFTVYSVDVKIRDD